MVYENEADVLCNICGQFIRREKVISPSEKKRVKVKFTVDQKLSMCDDCKREFFYDHDDLAFTYAISRVLLNKGVPEANELGRYLEFQLYILNHIRVEHKYDDPKEIIEQHREELHHLRDFTNAVNEIIERYRRAWDFVSVIERVPASGNPFVEFRKFMQGKIRRKWLRR